MNLTQLWRDSKFLWSGGWSSRFGVLAMWGMIACICITVGVEAYVWTALILISLLN